MYGNIYIYYKNLVKTRGCSITWLLLPAPDIGAMRIIPMKPIGNTGGS